MEGVGSLSLPLSLDQVRQLEASGDPAPYGRGTETVIDPDVRRATQLSAARVSGGAIQGLGTRASACSPIAWSHAPHRAEGAGWAAAVRHMTRAVAKGLGVVEGCNVEARLYKLLVYEPGGHFKIHRDTEKEAGMFATLV